MKKLFALLMIIMLLCTGCAANLTEPGPECPPENEPMPVVESFDTIARPTCINRLEPTEQQLYEDAEAVFIGMPLETFEESKLHYYAPDGTEYVHGVSERVAYHRTLRRIQVLEVLKGELDSEQAYVGEDAYLEIKDGQRILHVGDFYDVVQKNAKYIFYADKSEEGGFYFRREILNIDRLDYEYSDEANERYMSAKKRFAEQFEKYDRFDELSEPLPVKDDYYKSFMKNEDVEYTRYESEQALSDASDLVFVGIPVDTLSQSEYMHSSNNAVEPLDELPKLPEDYFTNSYKNRKVLILEVLKGEYDDSIIALAQYNIHQKYDKEGTDIGLGPAESPDCKNAKYIYYVTKTKEHFDSYFVSLDYGRINVDGLDKESYYESERVKEVKERYPEIFEKYDRTTDE